MESTEPSSGGIAKSAIINLSNLVAFQEGSIVSRQLVKKDAGNMTLFAFVAGQGLTEHTAPFDAFVHILEGEAEVTISKKPFQLRAGDAILMPASEPHAVKAISSFKMLLTMIRA